MEAVGTRRLVLRTWETRVSSASPREPDWAARSPRLFIVLEVRGGISSSISILEV